MFSAKTNQPRNTLFIFIIIHLFTLDAKASLVPKLDLHPELKKSTTVKTTTPESDTVPLHFSHLQSSIMRNMGYCELSIFEKNTDKFHVFPMFNVHQRSLKSSPRNKVTLKEFQTSPRGSLPSPRTHPYKKEYSIPKRLLCPENSLCISFFGEEINFSVMSYKNYYIPWQDLKDIYLINLEDILSKEEGKALDSLSLDINWNRKDPAALPIKFYDYNPNATLHELKYATKVTAYYKIPTFQKSGDKKSQKIKGV